MKRISLTLFVVALVVQTSGCGACGNFFAARRPAATPVVTQSVPTCAPCCDSCGCDPCGCDPCAAPATYGTSYGASYGAAPSSSYYAPGPQFSMPGNYGG